MTFIYNRRRIDVSALLLWIIFLIFSLNAGRNIPFFAFSAYLVSITNLFNIDFKEIVPLRFSYKKFQFSSEDPFIKKLFDIFHYIKIKKILLALFYSTIIPLPKHFSSLV